MSLMASSSGAGGGSGANSASGWGSGAGGRPPGGAGGPTPSGFISRYQILEKIGEGGMGSLYLARDPAIDRLLAIKLLRRGYDTDELRGRFTREAQAAGRLRHPNIVTIFDVGEHEGDPFIAMEFLAGETIDELIRHGARLSLARRLKLLEELCDGLSYAHRAGIVHRDIKPANLIVDSEGILKILDFGIVRLEEGGSTAAGMLVGTVNYMSPEQVQGGEIDHRSDIFAVGLVAYELLTSRQAFPGTIKSGLLNRILNVQYEPLRTVLPQLDPDVASIVETALKADPAERYQDLARMRNDLMRARQRIEAMEERVVDDMTSGGGETLFVTAPGIPTPIAGTPRSSPSIQAAERAFESGDYRKALTLAGRTAASEPGDHQASAMLARAQAALLERGRTLESSGIVARPGSAAATPSGVASGSGVAAPSGAVLPSGSVPVSGTYAAQAAHPLLWAIAGAVLILVVIVAGVLVPQMLNRRDDTPEQRSATPQEEQATPTQPRDAETAPAGDGQRAAATLPAASGPADRGATPPRPDPPPQRETPRQSRSASTATPPPASPASPAVPSIARAGRDVPVPRRTNFVEPQYPPAAAEAGLSGTVKLEITIGRDGRVADARVVDSVRGLDEAAVAAVRRWEYAPSALGGKPVPVLHVVNVEFTPPARPASTTPPPAEPAAKTPAQQPPVQQERPAPPPQTSARSTAPPAAPPAKPDPEAEKVRIRETLKRYEAAWEARDAAAVARVHDLSASDLSSVRGTLANAREYAMDIDVKDIRLDLDGRRATAICRVSRRFDARVGGTFNPPPATNTFTLERRGDAWIITSLK
jgi:serine/threonine-protein kinase